MSKLNENSITRNDATAALNFPSSDTVTLETASTERLRVDSSGNVGIGTDSPGEKLSVVGKIEARSGNWFLARSGDNSNYAYIKNPETSGSALGFYTSGEAMRIDSSGNVGIGTASPGTDPAIGNSAKVLEIIQTTAGSITSGNDRRGAVLRLKHEAQWENGYTGGDDLGAIEFLTGDASTGEGVQANIRCRNLTYYNTPALTFEVANSNSATLAERMRIDSSGNCGIGTTSPSTLLDVNGAATFAGEFVVGDTNPPPYPNIGTDDTFAYFHHDQDGGNCGIQIANNAAAGSSDESASIHLTPMYGGYGVLFKANREGIYNSAAASSSSLEVKVNYQNSLQTALTIAETKTATFAGAIKADAGIDFSGAQTNLAGMTSETLDAYEEGTWTPGLSYASGSGWNVTEQLGTYIKIGNQVQCVCLLTWDEGSGGGGVSITGLPFNVKSTSSARLGGYAIYLDGFSGLSGSNIFLYNTQSYSTALMFYVSNTNDSELAATGSDVTHANTSSSNTARFVMTYPT